MSNIYCILGEKFSGHTWMATKSMAVDSNDFLPYKIICGGLVLLKLGKSTVLLKLFCLGFA